MISSGATGVTESMTMIPAQVRCVLPARTRGSAHTRNTRSIRPPAIPSRTSRLNSIVPSPVKRPSCESSPKAAVSGHRAAGRAPERLVPGPAWAVELLVGHV
ncbi:hypothetical protein GCM10009735_65750 [Actinomadura chokoriensis]